MSRKKLLSAALLLCVFLSACAPGGGENPGQTSASAAVTSSKQTAARPGGWDDPALESYIRYYAGAAEGEIPQALLEGITSIRIEPDGYARHSGVDPYAFGGLPLQCAVYINGGRIGGEESVFWYGEGAKPVASLADLDRMPNLKELEIVWSDVKALPSEKVLSGLEVLVLEGAEISDLSALSAAKGLKVLSLSYNAAVSDFSPVGELASLGVLRLAYMGADRSGPDAETAASLCAALPELYSADFRSVYSVTNGGLGAGKIWNDPAFEYIIRGSIGERYGRLGEKLDEITRFVMYPYYESGDPLHYPDGYVVETDFGSCNVYCALRYGVGGADNIPAARNGTPEDLDRLPKLKTFSFHLWPEGIVIEK